MLKNVLEKFNAIHVFINIVSDGFFSLFSGSITVEVEHPIIAGDKPNLRYLFIVVPPVTNMNLLETGSM